MDSSSSSSSSTSSSTSSSSSFHWGWYDPPIPACYDFMNVPTNLISSPAISRSDGRAYIVLTSADIIPEMTDKRLSDEAKYLLHKTFVNYVLRKNRSQIRSFFDRENTMSSYHRVWMLYYNLADGNEKTQGPWTSDDLCFTGLGYKDWPTYDLDLPIYDPRDIRVERFSRLENGSIIHGTTGKDRLACFIPPLIACTSKGFSHTLENKILATKMGWECCMPKLLGVIGIQKDGGTYVVGTVFERITGIRLLNLYVPKVFRPSVLAELENGYEHLLKRDAYWNGNGPEDILVTKEGKLYFNSMYGRFVPYYERTADHSAIEKVKSFISRDSTIRHSVRVLEKTWTAKPFPRRRLEDLPLELLLMIFELVLIDPGKLFWAYGSILAVNGLEAPDLDLKEWPGEGLSKVLPEAHKFTYEKNHFVVEVGWLKKFLSAPKDIKKILEITIQVDATRPHGSNRPWREGIRELVRKYPQLTKIYVSIYGKVRQEWYLERFQDHSVLRLLRHVCRSKIAGVIIRDCGHRSEFEDANSEVYTRKEVEEHIRDWLSHEEDT